MRLSRLALVLPLVVMSLARCDCGEVLNDLPTPEIGLVDPQGTLHTDAEPWLVIALGDADTGQTVTQTMKVKNTGTGTLQVSQMCIVDAVDLATAIRADTPCLAPTASPFTFSSVVGTDLTADASADVQVVFRPAAGGLNSAFLRFASNADTEPLAAVQLTGRGTDGALCAQPPVADFGDVAVGSSKTLPMVVSNCGVKPITINEATFAINPDSAFSFTINGAAAAPPIGPLEAGESITVDATFTPPQALAYRDGRAGQIRLATATPFSAVYALLLVGNGVEPPTCRLNVVPQAVNFGSVAASSTQTRQLIVQSVGQCACTITGFDGPTPADAGFAVANAPALPFIVKGTTGCDTDPEAADTAPSVLTVDVTYTAPARPDPIVDNATITVTSNAAVDPVRIVNLEANGGGSPFCQLDVTPTRGGFLDELTAQGRTGIVEFGRTAVFIEKRLPIVATNIGNAACTISRVQYDKAENTLANEFSLEDEAGNSGLSTSPIVLEPGQSRTWYARFAPTRTMDSDNPLDVFSFGSYSGSLGTSAISCGLLSPNTRCNGVSFITDDTRTDFSDTTDEPGKFSVGFSGTPVEPSVDVIPSELDFGLVTLDCGSPERRTTIYNTGGVDLTVGQPIVDPATTPPTFKVLATSNPQDSPNDDTSGWPRVVPPGGSLSVNVRYFARQTGPQNGLLIIPTFEDGSDGPPITVPLRGEGTLERSQTDIFDQAGDPTVDVLFVVDDSGSMSDEQDQLGRNFPQFFTASNVAAADYHIAVTTTLTVGSNCVDLGGNANCADDDMSGFYTSASGDRFITPASANPESQFTANVQVSDTRNPSRPTSDGGEGGLRGAYNFLTAPKINDPAINGGFLRDEAKLHVIVVSDEPDQSRGPTDLYIDFFRNLKGFRNEGLVAVSAIAKRDGETCNADDGDVGSARYSEVVTALNGRFQSICDDDWSATMRSLGLDSVGLQVEFFLSRAATAASLNVCVRNGSPTAACTAVQQTSSSAANGWFFDSTTNSIVFNAQSVPPRGSRIEVRYEAFCFAE
jgi:hypothetical protein